jgi:hypothetical protein
VKFMLMLYQPDIDWPAEPEERLAGARREHEKFARFLEERGARFTSAALRQSKSAVTVRRTDGEPFVTDGPFVELKEHLGGFYIIDVKDQDEAVEIARRCPGISATEVRPIWDPWKGDRLWPQALA